MKKRIISMLIAIVMVVGLLPTAVFAAEAAVEATRVIYVDESTFLASGYSHFYDANENLLTATREEQEDGWVKYTMPADAKYYLTFDGHLGGGGGGDYPELPTNADTYDPSSDIWSCSHPGYAESNCLLCGAACPGHSYENGTCTVCGEPCPGHTYDNACDAECNVCSEIREVGDHVYDGAEDAECNECGYVRDITPAEITGVSITVDGETYTSGNVTITPTSTITLTVTGTNLLSGTDDNRVNYADGLIDPVTPYYFEINEDGTVATYELPARDFVNSSNFEIKYSNNYTDTDNHTVVPTGIYLTYDDGSGDDNTGGEEDTTPAEITGVSITVDGVEYTTGNVTITPTSTVTLTITGTNLQNGTDDHRVDYASGVYQPVTPDYFEISEDGTVATCEPSVGDFAKSSNFEITYCNNDTDTANRTVVPTGIYLTYDDGIAEENRAQITGMSITIDGVVYDSSNTSAEDPAVITPNTEFIIITVHGTSLQNCTVDHVVSYCSGSSEPILANNLWHFEADGTGAYHYYSSASALSDFARNTTPYELQYSNNGSFNAANPAIGSGVYIVYDDSTGGEEDPTPAEITGISITVDGETYTSGNVTITPTSTVTFTITGTNLQNGTEDHRVNYALGFGLWANPDYCDVSEDGTTATFASSPGNFTDCSNYEVVYYNNYTDDINRAVVSSGIYLTYESGISEEDVARITGVSITVDGVTYTEGDVTITPETEAIIVTVTGTHFANLSADYVLDLGPGLTIFMNSFRWEVDSDANTATANFSDLNPEFGDHNRYEIMYSNDGGQGLTGTGIYLTYDDGTGGEEDTTPDSTGKILVDMQDSYGDGWNDAAIQIYKNGSLEQTVTVDETSNTVFLDYDSTATYEFKWIKSGYDYECSFTIYVDGEEKLSVTDASVYENGETLWSQGDIGGEEGGDDTIGGEEDTTPAQITGVSITVDGVTYTSGNVTITPTSTIIYTVTGTNFANLSADNVVYHAPGVLDTLHNGGWTIDTETNTATRDFSGSISWFDGCDNFEVRYSNDGDVGSAYVGTGIYLTYDDGIEVNTTLAIGDNEIVDGDTYTYTAEQDGSLYITVAELYYGGYGVVKEENLGYWCAMEINGTAITDFVNSIEVKTGDTVTVKLISLDNDTYNGTINLSWDASVMAVITGVSITVDGVTYTEGDVTITPETESIIVTVTGTHFANLSGDYVLDLGPGLTIFMNSFRWEVDSDANTATADFSDLNPEFGDHNRYEIMYSNDGGQGLTGTGIYLTYDDGTGGEEDTTPAEITGMSIVINGTEFPGSYTSAGNPIVIPTDVSSVILRVYGTNLQNATSDYLVVFGPSGNSVGLDGDQWTIRDNGTSASYDMTWLVNEFTQAVPAWEIKYSTSGDDPADAITGLYVQYGQPAVEEPPLTEITDIVITGDTVVYDPDTNTYTVYFPTADEPAEYHTVFKGTNLEKYLEVAGLMWRETLERDGVEIGADYYYLNQYPNVAYREETGELIVSATPPTTAIGLTIRYEYSNDNGATWVPVLTQTFAICSHSFENGSCTICGKADGTPIITQQPTDSSAKLGDRFCVVVIAGGEGLKYQWYWRQVGTTTWYVSSQRDNTYDDVMTEARHNREVYCVITDSQGNSVTTETAILTAIKTVDLAFTKEPANVTVHYGDSFTITVEAVGEGVTYQWYYLDPGAAAWRSTNARGAAYSGKMSEKIDGRVVYCVASDLWGNQVATHSVLLSCERTELAITKQPNDASAKLGERFNVEVIAQGDGLKYQWYFRKVGVESWSISGVRDNTYDDVMTSARHNREVYCVITDAWGNSVETDIATITGTPTTTLAITRQPESQSVTIGDMFNVTFEAQGDGLRYQWYFRQAGTEVWHTSSQKDNSYDDVMTRARHNRELYCVVTDAWGNTVATDPIVVILAAPRYELAITAQPENESVKMGEMFCVTVEAQGDELRYQWYWRNVGSEIWNVSGQRDNTYDDVMTKARHNREVKCVITDMWGNSVETEIATITAIPDQVLAILAQPTDAAAAMGENFCVTVEAQGDGLTYQWYFKNAGATKFSKSGVKDNTYDDVMTISRAGRQIYCVITDMWGNTVTTETVTLVCS